MSQKYRLTALGWYNFERLVQTLLKAIIGLGVTSFGGSKDNGRDATFEGIAEYPSKSTQWRGYWVFQVKFIDYEEFTSNEARNRLKKELLKEIGKIIEKKSKIPENYILITNISLTADNRDELKQIVYGNYIDIQNFSVIDGNEICEFLDIFPNIRRTYPQLLGLADLNLLINSDVYGRSLAYYSEWSPIIGKFVETEAYFKANNSLTQHNFVVIDGPPEVGKSMIAAACAFTYSVEGYSIYVVENSNDLFKIRYSNEDEKHLYVADDAVGSLTFDPGLTESWSRDFSKIFVSLDKEHKLIWTSRSYVLKEAIVQSRIGEKIENFPGIHEVVVQVSALTDFEKAGILYNHAKTGNLNENAKNIVKINAVKIVHHPNFTPERIRQLINDLIPTFYEPDVVLRELNWDEINNFLNNPSNHWNKAYEQLNPSEKLLLSSMLDFEKHSKITELKNAYNSRISKLGCNYLSFEKCLDRLNESFLKIETYSYFGKVVLFQHPSIRDLLLLKIQKNANTLLKHIEIASPKAISEIIRGFGKKYTERENIEHLISVKSDEQFLKLLERIDNFAQMTLSQSDWDSILSSLYVLVPYKGLIKNLSAETFDFVEFSKTKEGKIISHVLSSFGSIKTYENCISYPATFWINRLQKFYYISHFIINYPKIEYLFEIYNRDDLKYSAEIEFDFIDLMAEYEPIFYKQIKSKEIMEEIEEYVQDSINEIIERGDMLKNSDRSAISISDYDEWYSDSDNLISFARDFYKFANINEWDSNLSDLEYLFKTFELPEEENESDFNPVDESDKEYWTIQKMFEDL